MWKFLEILVLFLPLMTQSSPSSRETKVSVGFVNKKKGILDKFESNFNHKLNLLQKNIQQLGRGIGRSLEIFFTSKLRLIQNKIQVLAQQICVHFGCLKSDENSKTGIKGCANKNLGFEFLLCSYLSFYTSDLNNSCAYPT